MFVLTALWIIQQKTLKIACAAVFIAQNTVRMATYFLISIIYFQKETVIGITFQQRVVFSERHKNGGEQRIRTPGGYAPQLISSQSP
jgi:hypothetical protein